MIIREVFAKEQVAYDKVVDHPLQSWAWGEARAATGVRVIRLGLFDEKHRLVKGWLMTVHLIPVLRRPILYLPRGLMPDIALTQAIAGEARRMNAVFVKLEPDTKIKYQTEKLNKIHKQMIEMGYRKGRNLFTEYNFLIDLSLSEDELMARMKPKTRYNIRLAQKKGVEVVTDNSEQAFAKYLELESETIGRQKFYAHDAEYHKQVWQKMRTARVAHLFVAKYAGKILTAWILFKWKDKLYYPYGASTRENKEVMSSNLMMWEAMKWGKANGCGVFDLWGTAGLNPSPADSWYGFHKFKKSYGPELVQYIGAYDYVIDPVMYTIVNKLDIVRRWWLGMKANLVGGKF